MNDHSIVATAVVLGERQVSINELATTFDGSPEVVAASLGDMVVYATARRRIDLAHDAARLCLERAGRTIADVDLLVDCRSRVVADNDPPIEILLGRPELASLAITGGCPVFFRAVWLARSWLHSEHQRCALVVYAEHCGDWPRIAAPINAGKPRDIFSDAAVAVLIEDGPGLALRGYGNAANAEYWAYFTAPAAELELRALRDSMDASKRALRRALDMAAFSLDEVRAVLMPNEVDILMRFIARKLRLPVSLLVRPPLAPSHAWAADPIYNLEHLLRERGLSAGSRVVCLSRGIGNCGVLALEATTELSVR